MNTLIPGTNRTPTISFNDGVLTKSGRTYMENSVEFYAPIKKLIDEAEGPIVVEISLDFFNTSSSKCLLELFHSFEKIAHEGRPVRVFWYHSPDCPDLEEAGEDYRDLVTTIPFELVEVQK